MGKIASSTVRRISKCLERNTSPPASHTNHVVQLLLTCHEDFEVKTVIGGFCGGTTTSINTEPWDGPI